MENEKQQLEALQDIRKMMRESSKFLSLSGFSGVLAGIYALLGAAAGYKVITMYTGYNDVPGEYLNNRNAYNDLLFRIVGICFSVLLLSIVTALIFSSKKAKKNGEKLFDHTSKKLVWNMMVPLGAGGLFCLALLYHGGDLVFMIPPSMLVFYGLALVNASKFTVHDIKYLGYFEIALGIISSFFLLHGLLFWAIGFGILHIIYGTIMWFKYDRNN